jgi:hypothetical protein
VARHLRPQSMAGDMIQPSCLASVARCERLGKIADAAERELAAMEKMTAPASAHRKLLKSIEAPYLKMPELLARLSQGCSLRIAGGCASACWRIALGSSRSGDCS